MSHHWTRTLNDDEINALSDAEFKSYITWASKVHSEAMEPIYAQIAADLPVAASDDVIWDIEPCGSYLNSDWGV